MTGGRLKRVADYIKDEEAFCFTYGDGVSNLNIRSSIDFHRSHGKLATVTAVQPPGRYGALERCRRSGDRVHREAARRRRLINGGFFVLSPRCLDLIEGDDSRWEGSPLIRLAAMGQMMAFEHRGFWQPMDTLRDKTYAGRALGIRQGAMENLALTRRARCRRSGATSASCSRVIPGFKGSWLTLWLHRLGAKVTGISLPPATTPNLYRRGQDRCALPKPFLRYSRCGGARRASSKRRGRKSFFIWRRSRWCARATGEPLATFETNVMGTVNVLDALRGLESVRVAVMVTTDKVYRDHEAPSALSVKTMRSAGTILTAPARRPAKSSLPAIGMPSCRRKASRWRARAPAT